MIPTVHLLFPCFLLSAQFFLLSWSLHMYRFLSHWLPSWSFSLTSNVRMWTLDCTMRGCSCLYHHTFFHALCPLSQTHANVHLFLNFFLIWLWKLKHLFVHHFWSSWVARVCECLIPCHSIALSDVSLTITLFLSYVLSIQLSTFYQSAIFFLPPPPLYDHFLLPRTAANQSLFFGNTFYPFFALSQCYHRAFVNFIFIFSVGITLISRRIWFPYIPGKLMVLLCPRNCFLFSICVTFLID